MGADADLLKADAAYDAAEKVALVALRKALPVGRCVEWAWGDRKRTGVVVEVSGWQYHLARVRVESDASGKVYSIYASMIVRELRDAR